MMLFKEIGKFFSLHKVNVINTVYLTWNSEIEACPFENNAKCDCRRNNHCNLSKVTSFQVTISFHV